jgi:hypothetical protein
VIADWLEEHGGHNREAWRERFQGLIGEPPEFDPDTATARVGAIPMGEGAWRRLLDAPPAEDLLCVFNRDAQAYQYFTRFPGRAGWDLGLSSWSSRTEREHLLAVPRLEFLACELIGPDDWDWIVAHLPGLTHFEAESPMMLDSAKLADLGRLPKLQAFAINGDAAGTSISCLPALKHFSSSPFWYDAADLAALVPNAETLHVELGNIGTTVIWPNLRSLQMHHGRGEPMMGTKEVKTIALHPHLERLNVRCENLKSTAIKALAALPRLRELTLRFLRGSVPSLKALAKAPALESLKLEGPLSDEHLSEIITTIPNLRVLSVNNMEAKGKALAGLTEMTQLEELELSGTVESVGGADLAKLAQLPNLVKVDLRYLTMPKGAADGLKSACPPWVECLLPEEE